MSEQRTALVTGASSGIGLATAHLLAKAGYRLAVTGPDMAALEAIEFPLDTLRVAGDLADAAFVASLVPTLNRAGSNIDLLVNNAAWRDLRSMKTIEREGWQRTLDICLTAPAFLARDAAADMHTRGRGVIVNVSSIMANRGFGGATAYIVAKAGLDAVTRDLAVLYGPAGVRVIGVAPGAIDTNISADLADGATEAELKAYSLSMIPAGRWGSVDDIARAIVAIASDDFAYLNGTTITLDGGWSAAMYPQPLRQTLQGGPSE